MRFVPLLVLAGVFVTIGCQPSAKQGGGMPAASTSAPQTPTTPQQGDGTTVKPPSVPGIPPTTQPQEQRFVIPKAGAENWKAVPPKTPAAPSVTEIATKVDTAMAGLDRAYCEYELATQGELTGQVKGRIMVRKKGDVYADYRDPADPAKGFNLLRLGAKNYRVEPDKPIIESFPEINGNLAENFVFEMPKAIALAAVGANGSFAQVVREFREKGMNVALERTTMDVNTKLVPFYRVLIQEKAGDEPVVEMRFDGNRMLPLTVRIVGKDRAGKRLLVQWSGRWSFNRPVDESVFVAPNSP
jgi:hypothetical protein